ncbi:MAG: type II toxin-antitoxin system RelE/ParE family toxin [Pirellulales bacterium]
MTLPVVYRPEAESDVLEARDYYERQRANLGDRFADALDEVVAHVAAQPELFAVVFRTVRRTKLRRFPYVVYYRILTDRVEIIAVLHGHRHPRTWRRRVD